MKPSAPPTRLTRWKAVAAELQAQPGRWMKVAENVSPVTVTRIKQGEYNGMVRGEYDAAGRVTPYRTEGGNPRVDVWARYVGHLSPEQRMTEAAFAEKAWKAVEGRAMRDVIAHTLAETGLSPLQILSLRNQLHDAIRQHFRTTVGDIDLDTIDNPPDPVIESSM